MFCIKCGKEIEDGAKFCHFCGAPTAGDSPAGGPEGGAPSEPVPGMGPFAPPGPEPGTWSAVPPEPNPGGGNAVPPGPKFNLWKSITSRFPALEDGKKSLGVLAAAGVAAVAVIALIVVLVSGVFGSPKGKVAKALAKTAAAYAEVGDKMGLPQELPDPSGLLRDRSSSQRLSVELTEVGRDLGGYVDLSVLEGLGLRVNTDWDQKGKKADLDAALLLDGDDIVSVQLLAKGGSISLASPELTRGNVYGVNTETLGADLDRLGVDGGEIDVEEISFNLFTLVEKLSPSREQSKEMEKAIADANKELFDAITAEKGGKKSVKVNGKSVEAALYKVVVPEDAMKDYIDAVADAMELMDTEDQMEEALLSMGLNKSAVKQFMSGMDTGDTYKELARNLKQLVKIIGDVELDVYVDGGYVAAVEYDQRIQGEKIEIGLYLGGGDHYVDNLSLEIAMDGDELLVESSGNHAGDKGVFTDETTIRLRSDRSDMGRVTSEFRYEPKAKDNNFAWEIDVANSAAVEMSGQLTTTRNSIDLRLDDITVSAMRMDMVSLKADYYLGPCKGMQVSLSGGTMLADMDEDDLEDLYYDIEENIEDVAYDLTDVIPSDVLWYLF